MSTQSYASSPNLSELMRLFKLDETRDISAGDTSPDLRAAPPPAPVATTRSATLSNTTTATRFVQRNAGAARGDAYLEPTQATFQRIPATATSGWNSSTQVAKTTAKPLKHQILCRNFVPQGPTLAVDRKTANQLLQRLSKATISSRMKGAPATSNPIGIDDHQPIKTIDVDRKRMHLQQRQAASRQKISAPGGEVPPNGMRSGREGIELLLYYRKEVEKRLRADPLYALHQDIQPY